MDPAAHDPSRGLYAQTMRTIVSIRMLFVAAVLATAALGAIPDVPVLRLPLMFCGTLVDAAVFAASCLVLLSGGAASGLVLLRRVDARTATLFAMAYLFPDVALSLLDALSVFVGSGLTALAMIAAFVAFLVLLARYGTVYPAILAGGDVSLGTARARVRADRVFWRLVGVLLFVVAVTAMAFLVTLLATTVFEMGGGTDTQPLAAILSYLLMSVVTTGASVATAVILCNAYRGVYPPEAS